MNYIDRKHEYDPIRWSHAVVSMLKLITYYVCLLIDKKYIKIWKWNKKIIDWTAMWVDIKVYCMFERLCERVFISKRLKVAFFMDNNGYAFEIINNNIIVIISSFSLFGNIVIFGVFALRIARAWARGTCIGRYTISSGRWYTCCGSRCCFWWIVKI